MKKIAEKMLNGAKTAANASLKAANCVVLIVAAFVIAAPYYFCALAAILVVKDLPVGPDAHAFLNRIAGPFSDICLIEYRDPTAKEEDDSEPTMQMDPRVLPVAPVVAIERPAHVRNLTAHVETLEYTRKTDLWDTADVNVLSKTVYGEAGNESPTQMAAVVWCVLNRVDSDIFPDDISSVATQPGQFQGYHWWLPIDPDVEEIVLDVLDRWQREKEGETEVGRILPKEYVYFWGDDYANHFSTEFGAEEEWAWLLPNPYTSSAS